MPEYDEEAQAERDAEAAAALAAALQEQDNEPALSQEELDAMFSEPEPVGSLVENEEEEEDVEDYDEPDDIPEPEPIPDVFTATDRFEEPERRMGAGLIALLVSLVVVAGLAAGILLARGTVMELVPASRDLYAALGLAGDEPGAGLEIREFERERNNEDGTDVLIIRGSIVNTTDTVRPVPTILIVFFDAGGTPLQEVNVRPNKPELAAGETLTYRARVENPPPLARRVTVTFAPTESSTMGGDPATSEPMSEQTAGS